MKATEIKENEKILPHGAGMARKRGGRGAGKKSPSAVYEGKSGVK